MNDTSQNNEKSNGQFKDINENCLGIFQWLCKNNWVKFLQNSV